MAVTGISNLVLLVFSIIAIVFILTFLTPFFKGIIDVVSSFLGGVGSEKLANAVRDTVSASYDSNGVVVHYYKITLGRGFYYIGVWQGKGWSDVCPSGAFCVVYFSPTDNVTAVMNAVKTGNTGNVTTLKSVLSFYTTDYVIEYLNGKPIDENIGVLVYVDGIKTVVWGVSSSYDGDKKEFKLSITAVSGADFFSVVKK